MSFRSYPSLSDHPADLVGRIPAHWTAQPVRHLIARMESGVSVNAVDVPAETGVPGVLKTSCVYSGEFDPSENKTVLPEELDRVTCAVTANTLIVSRMNTPDLVGAAGLARQAHSDLYLPDRLWQVHLHDAVPCYVHYWTKTPLYRAQVEMACGGTSSSMQNLSQDAFRAFIVPVPPASEQEAIASFLDRETAKIDALVEEQRRLIELLKEKRQAVISQAVTKGLDPNVPMKDSGVEWLGKVPAHWGVGKVGFYVSVLPGYAFSSADFSLNEGDTKLLRGINVGVGELRWDEVVYWARRPSDGLDVYELAEGDVVIGMDRPLIASGMRVARVTHSDLPCLLLQRVAKVQPGPLMDSGFIMRLLSSQAFEAHFAPETTGVSVPHISGEQICDFLVPVPPLNEQRRIREFLGVELAKLDTLNREAEFATALLSERRSALICAAVTGKIDVRGLATQPEAAVA